MKKIHINLIAIVIAISLISPVMAQKSEHNKCMGESAVYVNKMGVVNEEVLQQHIDKLQKTGRCT